MSNDDDDKKDDNMTLVGGGVITGEDLRAGNLPDDMPDFVKQALKQILPRLEETEGQLQKVNPKKVAILSDMFLKIWNAQPCYNNPADMLAACLLRAKLMRMDGEQQDVSPELFADAEKVAEELFQQASKNPDPEDPSVH